MKNLSHKRFWVIRWRVLDDGFDKSWRTLRIQCGRKFLLGYMVALQTRLMRFYRCVEVMHD